MDAERSSLTGVDPKDLEISNIDSGSQGVYTCFEAPQTKSSNGTHSSHDSWPNVPPSAEASMATALDEPYLGMGAFDIDMSTFDADFQMDDLVGISAENDQTRGLQSVVNYDKPTNMSPTFGLGAQEALPLFMYPSLQQRLSQNSQTSDQNFAVSMTNQYSAKIQKSRPSSSLHALNRVSPESRSTRRPRRCMTRTSITPNPRLITSQTLNSCQPPSSRNLKPLAHSVLRNKNQRKAPNIQVSILPSKCTTDNDTSHTYSTMLRDALALAKGSIRPYSSFSRRKAIDIINQVANLVDQLDLIAIEEEKYGSAATDDDDLTQPSTNTEESLSNSELVDVDSGTDNTSVSSLSRQPVVENQNTVSVTDHMNETGHPPCLQCGIKSLYYCTREGCTYSTHSCAEWKRHEESQKHSQQERFMCLECPQSPPLVDVNGDPICEFCKTSFPSLGNLSAHYLQCQHAQRSSTTYGRKDRLIAHLRDHHTINNANQVAAAGRFTVDSQWPRQCGFCGVFFKTWDERMGHVASHFQEGLDMSAWKLPLPRSKDFHPTFKPQPKHGDDSDDDMNDTDGRPGHHKTGAKQDPSSASSGLKQNSNTSHGLERSHQRDRRHRNHDHPANQNNETIETTDATQLWGTLVDKYWSYWTDPLACERASVTLERYLNDVEEPFHIQSSAKSPGSPDRTLCRDTAVRGVNISSSGAYQKSTKQILKGQRQTKSNDETPASKVLGNSDTQPNSNTSHQYQRKPITCQEQFDPSYQVRNSDWKDFFRIGRVFSILWTDSLSNNASKVDPTFVSEVKYGERVYSKIRRFIIVRESDKAVSCLPVTSYASASTQKSGTRLNEHGFIYSRNKPRRVEEICSRPLKLNLGRGAAHLKDPSLVNVLSAFHKPRRFLYERFLSERQLLPELLPNPKQTPSRLNANSNAPSNHVQNYAVPGFNSCLVCESILSPTIGLDFGCGFETSQSITRQFTIDVIFLQGSTGCEKNVLSSILMNTLQATAVSASDTGPQNTSGHAKISSEDYSRRHRFEEVLETNSHAQWLPRHRGTRAPELRRKGSLQRLCYILWETRSSLSEQPPPNDGNGCWMDATGVHGDHIRSSYGLRIPGAKELNGKYPAMELSGSDDTISSSEDDIRVFGWHGDIKPENILSFPEDTANEHRLLVTTNFGLPTLNIKYQLYEAVAAPAYNSHISLLWVSMWSNPPRFPPVPSNYPPKVLTLYGSRNIKIAEACAVKTYRTPSRKASGDVVSRYRKENEQEFLRAKEYINFQYLLFQNSKMPESPHKKHHSRNSRGRGHKYGKKHENKTPEYRREWFWSCCSCNGHGAMSTFIDQCPTCDHIRCEDCTMESVKIRAGR